MQPRTTFYAFFHWVNWVFLLGAGYASLHTAEAAVAAVAAVLEILWLTGGARLSFFQRYAALRNGQIEQKMKALRSLQAQQKLSYEYKQRYRELEKAKAQLLDAAKANKRLELGAIAPELQKIEELLESFIRIAVAHKKLTTYLGSTTEAQLQADVEKASDPALKDLAQKRLAEHTKIIETEKALGVQLETIEKTLGYLKTKIISLEKPADFGHEIQSVVMGVEAAERTLAATDAIEEEIQRAARQAVSH